MNLYPYVVETKGTLPWTGLAEFPSVSPCMDAILESEGGFESFNARFVHNQPPTSAKWIEILIHEGNHYGGPYEAGYLFGRARLPAPEGTKHFPSGYYSPGGTFEAGYRAGSALPQIPKTRNLEWGFFGVWRMHYLACDPGDPTNGRLPPPSVAWTFLMSAYLELFNEPPTDVRHYVEKFGPREDWIRLYLDMPPGRRFCEGAMSEIALGIHWKVAILHELIGPPARFRR